MSFPVFDLMARLFIDKQPYEEGLAEAKGDAEKGGSLIGDALKGVATVGAVAVGAATTAVVGFSKSAVDVGMAFDSSMSQVAATMGMSVAEMESDIETVDLSWGEFTGNLTDYAKEIGRNTAFSATQASEALNYMALAGYDTKTSMEMLPNVMNLAAAGSMDLARASDMVTDASSALGLNIDETTELVNKLAQASSKSNTSVSQLGDAILTVGGTAKSLKGGTTELSAALGILADNGVKGAEGGTALRNMILSLSAPTDKAAQQLDAMGISVYDAEGKMRSLNDIFGDLNGALSTMSDQEKTNVLNDIFNKVDLKSANAMLSSTTSEFYNLAHQAMDLGAITEGLGQQVSVADYMMVNYGKSASDVAEMMRAAGDKSSFAALMMEQCGAEAYEADAIWDALSDSLENSSNRFDELSGMIDDAGDAAEKMAQTQLDNLSGAITIFNSAVEGAQLALSGKLAPALTEFVQLGTSSVSELTKAFEDGGLDGLFEALPNVIQNALDAINGYLPQLIDTGVKLTESVVKGLIQAAPSLISAVAELGGTLIGYLAELLPQMVDEGIKLVGQISAGLVQGIPEFISNILPMILAFTGGFRENAKKIVDAGIDLVLNLADGLIEALPALIEYVPQIISNIAGIINDNAPKMILLGGQLIIKLGVGIIESIPALIANFGSIVQAIIDVFMAFNWMDLGITLIDGLAGGLMSMFSAPLEAINTLINSIFDAIAGFDWLSTGAWILSGIANGISSLLEGTLNLIKDLANGIVDFVTSVDWLGLGLSVMQFLMDGISSLIESAVDLFVDLTTAVWDWVSGVDWLGLGESILSAIKDGISLLVSSTFEIFVSLSNQIGGFITGFDWLGTGKAILTGIINGITTLVTVPFTLLSNLISSIGGAFRGFDWHGLGTLLLNGIINGIRALVTMPWNLLKGAIDSISSLFRGFDWHGLGTAALNGIVNGIRALVSAPVNLIRDLVRNASNVFTGFDWLGIGRNVVEGVVNGIRNAGSLMRDALVNMAKSAFNGVKSFFGINSPSKTMEDEIGEQLPPGAAIGVKNKQYLVEDAMEEMAEGATKAFEEAYETPEIEMPDITAPEITAPEITMPAIKAVNENAKATEQTDARAFSDKSAVSALKYIVEIGDQRENSAVSDVHETNSMETAMALNWLKSAANERAEKKTASTTGGSVTLNVYASPGMDVNELAEIVIDRLNRAVERENEVFA